MRLTEMKYKCWRALAIADNGKEHLLYLGNSHDQVKKNYMESFRELLLPSEQDSIKKINIERWSGIADQGKWIKQDSLKIPQHKIAV